MPCVPAPSKPGSGHDERAPDRPLARCLLQGLRHYTDRRARNPATFEEVGRYRQRPAANGRCRPSFPSRVRSLRDLGLSSATADPVTQGNHAVFPNVGMPITNWSRRNGLATAHRFGDEHLQPGRPVQRRRRLRRPRPGSAISYQSESSIPHTPAGRRGRPSPGRFVPTPGLWRL